MIRGEIEQKGGNVDFRRKVVGDFDGEMVVGLAEEMVGKLRLTGSFVFANS